MPRYIDADALIDDLMERYCKECNKRKGIKNGKYRIIYEIGEAPCRACEVDDVKAELEEAPTIDVPNRKVGEWEQKEDPYGFLTPFLFALYVGVQRKCERHTATARTAGRG